jgi:WD40 repeat protein
MLLLCTASFTIYGQANKVDCESIYANGVSLFRSKNYQLALKKLTAYKACGTSIQQRKADTLIGKINEAIENQGLQIDKNQKEVKRQTQIALLEGDKAQANILINEAKRIVDAEPNIALRLAEEAMKNGKSLKIIQDLKTIYRENSFYKSFIKNDSIKSTTTIDFSPNGKILVLPTHRKTYFYNEDGRLIHVIDNTKFLYDFYPQDDRVFILNIRNGDLKIIDKNGKETSGGNVSVEFIEWIKIAPSGDYLLLKSFTSPYCQLVNFSKKSTTSIISSPPSGFLPKVKFSVTGNLFGILSADSLYTVSILNKNGEKLGVINDSDLYGTDFIFSANDEYVALWKDSTLLVYNLHGDTILEQKCNKNIYNVEFVNNDKEIFIRYTGNSSEFFNLDGSSIEDFIGAKGKISSDIQYIIEITKDKKRVLIKDLNGNILQELKGCNEDISDAKLSPNGKYIYTVSIDKTVRMWYLKYSFSYFENNDTTFSYERINNTRISYSGQLQLKYLNQNDPRFDSVIKYNKHILLKTNGFINSKWDREKANEGFEIEVLSPTNKKIIDQYDSLIILYELRGNIWKKLDRIKDDLHFITISPQGNKLIITQKDSMTLYNLEKRTTSLFKRNNETVEQVAFAPTGQIILIETTNWIKLFDLAGIEIASINDPDQRTKFIAFSPDGGKILIEERSGSRKPYKYKILSKAGIQIGGFSVQHTELFDKAFFSVDGKFIYTITDNKIKQLDLNGELQFEVTNRHPVDFMSFRQDGKILVLYSNMEITYLKNPPSFSEFLKNNDLPLLKKGAKR